MLQIVGHDADSLGGWDAASGKRLWAVKPPAANDFNVPTPIDLGDRAFTRYAAPVATGARVLAVTLEGESVLFDAAAGFRELGRLTVLPGEEGLYSHPAFVGARPYVRGSSALTCRDNRG